MKRTPQDSKTNSSVELCATKTTTNTLREKKKSENNPTLFPPKTRNNSFDLLHISRVDSSNQFAAVVLSKIVLVAAGRGLVKSK